MDYLLIVGYGSIFLALIVYVLYLQSRLSEAEKRLDDLSSSDDGRE